ncbi:MAG TPA: Hsp20/alpha crystallin family protein [Candidatus Sumerlaeota bacterium]|nr:MAG: Acid shock protein [candidate division BRC1 bacterium ADurb.BinA292]HOE94948.1 Hsp20/alpha crystallin family protein [Candidatus Sumerlaeota bacterium]HOR27243.1 Hsp20/alpha crystallin family protein [Candidatus Sumerlaeota bacterium]HPK01799.1 Hsp20/alpha crystallin family protein [Candidatus Sumerlaeota bacterium]
MAETTIATTNTELEARPTETREPSRYQIPPVDIYEHDHGLTVFADMPGVSSDRVEVNVDNDVLTIRGRVQRETKGDAVSTEFAILDYFRQFKLNQEVDQEKITAKLNHGVLTIDLPKVEAARPRQIPVSVG